ncbi:uncharacterized protein LOC141494158 [Macrotis lagotis]|uniref:uncharacterized protein LOC141494158 n=1 Tax=Macrotis lagotis TaxID=92651 RepID=UPI003D68CF9D
MKKCFQKKGRFPSCDSVAPRRDNGPRHNTGYLLRDRDLGKIHQAASVGDVAKVQHLLLLKKQGLNDLDKVNRTPLHLACANGYPDVVSLLVERKCQLNIRDNDNRTPLIKAVQCQQEECVTILLDHGADPHLGDSKNNTALHYSASGQNMAIVAKLLKHKSEIEAKNKDGYTPLLVSVTENNQAMVEFLLKNGANVNAMDKTKRTALMIAVSGAPTDIVSLLLKYSADLLCQDKYGWTAEEYAIVSGFPIHRQLINECAVERELNQSLSTLPSSANKASATGSFLDEPAMEKEGYRASIAGSKDLETLSDKFEVDDSWLSIEEEELDFVTKEESVESEEGKKDGILIGNGPREQTSHETSNILKEFQTHRELYSGNRTARKDIMSKLRLEEGDDTELPWDSESASESLPKGCPRFISSVMTQTTRDSISMEQFEDVFFRLSFMNGSKNFKMDKLKDTRSIGIPANNMDATRVGKKCN